jgi:hypothetical protein
VEYVKYVTNGTGRTPTLTEEEETRAN